MEVLDSAGHAVLHCYGQFLDSLLLNLFSISNSFMPINKLSNSIEVQMFHKERTVIYDLIDTDSKTINKILIVFTSLCKEIEYLKNEFENEFLKSLVQYEEEALDETSNEEIHIIFSKFLPKLLDILIFVKRCRQVLTQFLRQIHAAFNYSWSKDSQNIMHLKFQEIFIYLGDLLLLFVSLDLAINFNDEKKIAKHMQFFLQQLKLSAIPDKRNIYRVLTDIQNELLSQNILQATLHNLFEQKLFLQNWNNFPSHFNRHLKRKLTEIEKSKENDICDLRSLARLAVSHAFITKCFGLTDKKVHRMVLELSKKFVVVPLFGDLIWIPGVLLSEYFDSKNNEVGIKVSASNMLSNQKKEAVEISASNEVKHYSFLVFKWALQMEDLMSRDTAFSKINGDMAKLCIEGLLLSEQIQFCIHYMLKYHNTKGNPITKMSVLNMCKLIELLKGVQSVFYRHHTEIGKHMNHTVQKKIMQILSMVMKIKNDVFKSGFQEKYLDSYSSLLLTEKILYSSCSEDKILVIRLALTLVNHHPLIDHDSMENIQKLINELFGLCALQNNLEKKSEVNFFFLEENILPIYFKHLTCTHSSTCRLQYLLHSLLTRPEYDNQRKNLLQIKVIKDLCEEIEIHLRLHAHSHLKDDKSLEKSNINYHAVLYGPHFRVYNYFMTIKGLVELYIDETFYDLTTVALHDWQSYREMRSLADHQFNLETVDDNLPSQTVSQGLDVLEIMRSIHIFVSKYLYNLNTQCFVEYTSNNKHLNTIRIHQIANSIWTHGTGIMNTTVNFIYQFLRRKLLLCSQFLYDEHINSRLTKDYKYFTQQKLQKHAIFPYERAEKFNKGISRLKTSSDGLSYLDQYRILISQIGNALGYVRMIRSGGLHHSISAVSYYPVIDYVNVLENIWEGHLSMCNESFEKTFFNALHHLNVEIDALKLLVEVFQSVFHLPENDHLRLFVMIIPPLTINFVHYIVTSKEKLSKRNSTSGLFTDDGFAIGVAYLLSVFNLNEEFESLHWFESVYDKYDCEEKQLFEAKDISEKEDGNGNTVNLSIKRLQMYKQEFELLCYNLNSAKVFFSEGGYRKKEI